MRERLFFVNSAPDSRKIFQKAVIESLFFNSAPDNRKVVYRERAYREIVLCLFTVLQVISSESG